MANTPDIHPPSSILHPRPIFIAGPTAVGKSEVALRLAEQLGGEIISADSMQVYRGLDIGTAKPSPAERARVPHHLIDICDLTEAFDAAQFIRLAQSAVTEIQARGHVPVFCGGTGLYFKAFLSGLGEAPATNPELRAELEAAPFEALLHELRERDPVAYEQIDKQNPRRVIRAVEVIRLTGKPFSAQRARWGETRWGETPSSLNPKTEAKKSGLDGASPHQLYCLTRASADMHARINARVDTMFTRGLVEETRALLQHGLAENKTAMQAIGYRQVVEYLRDQRPLPETIELVKSRTRQFAKRQLTWFRRHGNMEWIELKPGDSLETAAENLRRNLDAA
ncbi:MAG: tRNA (adenosine(37)-N6)-dimethylallyltransferase MiaA [Verrucomicrobiales bacterium]|nr:tRNA (adenosine(37)-N6)-dimethylallyltransferase MiaA [Verrucomicrobiales bacterium]